MMINKCVITSYSILWNVEWINWSCCMWDEHS